jgi:hypothetical protein
MASSRGIASAFPMRVKVEMKLKKIEGDLQLDRWYYC